MSCSSTEPTTSLKRKLDEEESEFEMPPVPPELIALAGDLLALGDSGSIECVDTLLRAEELCIAFWETWWSK